MKTDASRVSFGIAVLLGAVVLTGCDPQISRGKQALEARLKDPASVQYKDVVAYSENVVCGEYNAKNEMGGYTGFKRFITLNGTLVEGDELANSVVLCDNEIKHKVKVERFDLKEIALTAIDAKSGKDRSWTASIDIFVEEGRKNELQESKKSLTAIAETFLKKNSTGPSFWPDHHFDPDRDMAVKRELQAELQKHVKNVEIKGISLLEM